MSKQLLANSLLWAMFALHAGSRVVTTRIDQVVLESLQNPVTLGFLAVMGLIFLRAISAHKNHDTERAVSVSKTAPAILTTIGVLGTFVGIFMGLLEFDVGNIDASIPVLLSGLKIAFVTSIVGMFLSVVLKAFQILNPTERGAAGVSADDIHFVLCEIREIGSRETEISTNLLTNIHQSIAGDADSSLNTQLLKMRTETGDKLSDLSKDFKQFAEKMAENNSKTLIAALEEVMRDFNAKINEQFGENFKQLNEAVGQLLVWQENYRKQMDNMVDQIEKSFLVTQAAESSLEEIAKRLESIPKTMSDLETIMKAVDNQIKAQKDVVAAFEEIGQKAGDAFPIIETNLKNLTETMGEAVGNCVSTVNKTVGDMTASFQQTIKNSQEALGAQITALDEEMQNEVKRVVEIMGSHLTSLSSKFVEDYSPLTDKLKKLVDVGRI